MDGNFLIEGIFIAKTPGSFVSTRIYEVELEFGGIRGDRHFGMTFPADSRQPMYQRGVEIVNKRQISIVSVEELAMIQRDLCIDMLQPEWLGANLLLSGISNLTSLAPNMRLLFPSGAGLICESENYPCIHAGEEIQKHHDNKKGIGAKFVKYATKKRGVVCSVERPGWIREGDIVQLISPREGVQ